MRVLQVDSGRQMRGGQWQVLYLLERLAEPALMARSGSPLFEAARRAGFQVLPWAPGALRSSRFDLIHVHDAHSHTVAALIAGRPVVVSRRVAFPVKGNLLSRWKYSRPAHFIAVSHHVAGVLAGAGVPERKISVVYDGVPLPPPPERPGGLIVAAGTTDPQKGADIIGRAAALGGFTVRYSADLASDLRQARLFLYVTRQEGLGSAALLAMAAGVPVVASAVGGLPEAVADGETGILVENTPEAVAGAVNRLLSDPGAAARMGAAGRSRVERLFSADAMLGGTLQVYHRVLSC